MVAAILIVVVIFGFAAAITAGLAIATVMFVYSYASIPVIRRVVSLAQFQITVERPRVGATLLVSGWSQNVRMVMNRVTDTIESVEEKVLNDVMGERSPRTLLASSRRENRNCQ